MPGRRFSDAELAAAAAIGELRTEVTFEGDVEAWRTYQNDVVLKLTGEQLPPVGDGGRAARWKAARRQLGQIEGQRLRDAEAQPARQQTKAAQLVRHPPSAHYDPPRDYDRRGWRCTNEGTAQG